VRQEVISLQKPRDDSLLIRFTATPEALRAFAATTTNSALRRFVDDLQRALPVEAFDTWVEMKRSGLAERLGLEPERVERGLDFLRERELLQWSDGRDAVLVTLLAPRSAHVPYDESAAQEARHRSETRLGDMIRYARSLGCRRRFLLAYFGESAPELCGKCDVCLGRHAPLVVTPDHEPVLRQILAGLRAGTNRDDWFGEMAPSFIEVNGLLDWLLREGYVEATDPLEERFELTDKGRRARV
ncbi:MAG TPA: RecQ family zinc-binding domain-containing protein, partial [Rhodothermales bacterium]